ncbi:hypothetical protein GCM10011247_38370 [Pseudomonas plecoglossicida]|uniref:REase associating with pPIWI RE domain-containing protein n=2 Tax=Pseudomonas plecoglossicida TaxID=70775 RepID=A0AAD0QU92_PSEDL|nr:hypothetical protein DVB73_07975 [Pseudomonas plecoglossicida]EPB96780.1 hypothetical protein L321_06406 [Pseudomonas plecoglossicida NB2011]QLB56487.1 hypothetical protein HAV28_17515 [Pseudomonas plecoglossicida]GLR38439.1 hypothetical protein GCM10011247_38370 [Pseudomonas plecoglossicida]
MDRQAPEYLLNLLAQGASLCATDRGQAFVLFQRACALLWRLDPTGSPISPIELERRLRTPLEDWLPESVRADYSGPLLYFDIFTQTCSEMLLELDAKAVWDRVQESVNRVKQACRLRADGELHYRNFRLFLVQHGVIWPAQASDTFLPLNLSLSEFYEPIAPHLFHNGLLYLCPECKWPMNTQRHEVSCASAWCQDKKSLFVRNGDALTNRVDGTALNGQAVDGRLMLKPALWKFTLQPGLIEFELAQTLAGMGFDVQLWPDVDRTDLRFRLGHTHQDIDAKVWMSAYRLAEHIKAIPTSSPRWIVIPDYQKQSLPLLRKHCNPGVSVYTQSQCVQEAKKRAAPF